MAIDSHIDNAHRLVLTYCHGFVMLEDFIHYHNGTWSDISLFGYNELFDATQGDFSKMSFADFLTVAERTTKLYALDPASKVAIVIAPGDQEKLSNFYLAAKKVRSERSRIIQIFHDRDDALSWLTQESN